MCRFPISCNVNQTYLLTISLVAFFFPLISHFLLTFWRTSRYLKDCIFGERLGENTLVYGEELVLQSSGSVDTSFPHNFVEPLPIGVESFLNTWPGLVALIDRYNLQLSPP